MATIISSVSGNNVTFKVQIAPGDPQNWEIIVNSKQQDGRMASGYSDYPWYVEFFQGTGSQQVTRSYVPGDYAAELDVGGKPADYSIFSVAAPAPQVYPFVLVANFSGVPSGTNVTFSGTYKPNTAINLFIEGLVRQHLAQVTTDSQGKFITTVPLTISGTTTTTYKIAACTASTVPGWPYECALLPDLSNYVYVSVGPAPTPVLYSIQITAGTGGQVQVFQNGKDLGYFRGTKTVVANPGDNISVWADPDSGYEFKDLCTPDGTCTTARPFNFVANMNISMTATFQSSGAPPPGVQPNHALMINLSPLSWADLNGLAQYLPAVAKAFADALTLYGILGITITKTAIEQGNLVIYYNQAGTGTTGTTGTMSESDKYVFMPYYTPYRQLKALPQHAKAGFMTQEAEGTAAMAPGGAYSPGWAVDEHVKIGFMDGYPYCTPYCLGTTGIETMQLPQEVAIPAAIITIAGIALRFGFLIVGWSVVNLATKYVEVQKTQADTAQTATTTIADMCKSGQLTPAQCAEALDQSKKKEECWITNPLGGCVLSASTGKAIVGTVALIGILGAAYWLSTRHPEEVRRIAAGARQAVTGEYERARTAYRGYTGG